MHTFILALVVWNNAFVIDSGMTQEDCANARARYLAAGVYTPEGSLVKPSEKGLVCYAEEQ